MFMVICMDLPWIVYISISTHQMGVRYNVGIYSNKKLMFVADLLLMFVIKK